MADRNITLIKYLDNMKDDYTLKVSIIRLWRSLSDGNPTIVKSIEMILMDEMDTLCISILLLNFGYSITDFNPSILTINMDVYKTNKKIKFNNFYLDNKNIYRCTLHQSIKFYVLQMLVTRDLTVRSINLLLFSL
ncbi:uncharacterized protein LOC111893467 [Lactuca sativa]|uniref:uncharacterized protein LOC111893467 n=1 Tax=Lactuca sativa TaxID=4236 RepID=UPI001C68A140|nr:uncharacterized protein LOC111893467 [Lactuca sativa]